MSPAAAHGRTAPPLREREAPLRPRRGCGYTAAMNPRFRLPALLFLSAFLLAACGNKGDLFHPPPPEEDDVLLEDWDDAQDPDMPADAGDPPDEAPLPPEPAEVPPLPVADDDE